MTVVFIEQRGGPVLVMSIDVLGMARMLTLDPCLWGGRDADTAASAATGLCE
jgi:hypothetical protein